MKSHGGLPQTPTGRWSPKRGGGHTSELLLSRVGQPPGMRGVCGESCALPAGSQRRSPLGTQLRPHPVTSRKGTQLHRGRPCAEFPRLRPTAVRSRVAAACAGRGIRARFRLRASRRSVSPATWAVGACPPWARGWEDVLVAPPAPGLGRAEGEQVLGQCGGDGRFLAGVGPGTEPLLAPGRAGPRCAAPPLAPQSPFCLGGRGPVPAPGGCWHRHPQPAEPARGWIQPRDLPASAPWDGCGPFPVGFVAGVGVPCESLWGGGSTPNFGVCLLGSSACPFAELERGGSRGSPPRRALQGAPPSPLATGRDPDLRLG